MNFKKPDFLINEFERFWVDLQPFLLHRGYRLRPRYDPNWTPPWLQGKPGEEARSALDFEDSLATSSRMLDAIRIRDGQKVVFKKVKTEGEELPIALFLSSIERQTNPRNCAVPILDVIPIPGDDDRALLVMPHLLPFHELPFRRLGEFCEMALQLVEGLQVMHEKNIAHRDFCRYNIMMDHSKVVPKGTHFLNTSSHDGIHQSLDWNTRWSVRPVQYYIIDFGISMRCASKDVTVLGKMSQDKTVPELSDSVPYDPFPVDIYQLGNVFKKCIQDYDGLEAFDELAKRMTEKNPHKRPPAAEAAQLCKQLISTLESSRKMEQYVWRRTTSTTTALTFMQRLGVIGGFGNPMD